MPWPARHLESLLYKRVFCRWPYRDPALLPRHPVLVNASPFRTLFEAQTLGAQHEMGLRRRSQLLRSGAMARLISLVLVAACSSEELASRMRSEQLWVAPFSPARNRTGATLCSHFASPPGHSSFLLTLSSIARLLFTNLPSQRLRSVATRAVDE